MGPVLIEDWGGDNTYIVQIAVDGCDFALALGADGVQFYRVHEGGIVEFLSSVDTDPAENDYTIGALQLQQNESGDWYVRNSNSVLALRNCN